MRRRNSGLFWMAVIVAVASLARPAAASPIDLGHPTLSPFNTSGAGGGDRSLTFDALTSFSITSAGIVIDPLAGGATNITVDIYASSYPTETGRVLLSSASTAIVDAGLGFYDIPIAFAFIGGARYDVAFRPTTGNWGPNNTVQFYSYQHSAPSGPYTVGGFVSVLDGSSGSPSFAAYSNSVMPHVRFDAVSAVPEPTSLLLLGTGLLGALAVVKRRRTSSTREPRT